MTDEKSKTPPKAEEAKAAETPKVDADATAKVAEQAKADAEAKAKAEAEEKAAAAFEAALKENDGDLSAEQQAILEKHIGDQPEPEVTAGGVPEDLSVVFDKLRRLNRAIPETTPNEHTLWGAGGVVLTIGDIRTIIRYAA